MRRKKSLKTIILIYSIGSILIALAGVNLVTKYLVNREVSNVILEKSIAEAKQIASQIEIVLGYGGTTKDIQELVEHQVSQNDYLAYAVVIDTDVVAIAHSDKEKIGKDYSDDTYTVDGAKNGQIKTSKFYADMQEAWTYDVMVPVYKNGNLYGAMDVGIYEEYIAVIQRKLTRGQSIIMFITIILLIMINSFVCNILFKKLNVLVKKCDIIGRGDFSVELEDSLLNRGDEIGEIAIAINNMKEEIGKLILASSQESNSIAGISKSLSSYSDSSQEITDEIVESVESIIEGSRMQDHLANRTAAMTDEINSGMESVAVNIQSISESSGNTLINAQKGGEAIDVAISQMDVIYSKVNDISTHIHVLNEKSVEIEQVIDFITNIANQTNLLALNAAIEAARAGEQGKGFNVVAGEVRVLAEQCTNAAKKIVTLISDIRESIKASLNHMEEGTGSVKEGIVLVEEAKHEFTNILTEINEITGEIGDVSAVVEEVTASTSTLLQSMHEISHISKQSAEKIEDTFEAVKKQSEYMHEVNGSADELRQVSDELNKCISIFKL